jgi:SAM-dependent methyltransferase
VCLDVGCGGGDVTRDLARLVGPRGKAVGVDIDEMKLAVASAEAREEGPTNLEFRSLDIRQSSGLSGFDVVYARFLLTHLGDPAGAVKAFYEHLRPGGQVAVEDIDYSGCFTYPKLDAFERYCALYCAIVRRRGGDPNIGPRLPLLLMQSGFEQVGVSVVQPVGLQGDVKLIHPITLENITGPILEDGLATQDEIDGIVRELYTFAADPGTVAGTPRVVQAWGRRPAV